MPNEKYTKVKASTLVSLVLHGANDFGLALAKTLSEQGSRVILIDYFNKETKPYVSRLKKLKDADFIAFEGLQDLFDNLGRFDYLFYLQNNLLNQDRDFGSKGFLEESNHLEQSLKAAAKFNVKTTLVTTIFYNKKLLELGNLNLTKHSAYSSAELQKYSETLAAEYHDKSKLNIRILRLGTLFGTKYPAIGEPALQQILEDSVNKSQITIYGEGLENHYIINVKDAIYAILKLTFTANTSGEVITLSNRKPLTTLSIAYKILELNTEATNIKFEDLKEPQTLLQGQYNPAPNAEEFGWKPDISLEESFVEAISGVYEDNKKKWAQKPTKEMAQTSKNDKKDIESDLHPNKEKVHTVKTPLGKFIENFTKPFSRVSDTISKSGESLTTAINFKNILLFGFGVIVLSIVSYFLITPFASIGVNSLLIYYQRDDIKTALGEFNLSDASDELDKTSDRVESITLAVERLEWLFTATGQTEMYDNFSQITFAAGYAVDGAKGMSESLQPLAEYAKEFQPAISFGSNQPSTTREYTDNLQTLRDNRGKLEKAGDEILLASKIIETTDLNEFPQFMQPYILEIKEQNAQVQDLIEPFQNTVLFLPELLGIDERQRYLILLQNPSELRSTGGWLSSYAIIGIENGQIRQLEVDDIYNADGQLISQDKLFDPPQSMQDALDIDTWAFSLSNWSADFPHSANDAQFFVKESGKALNIDGVITLDVTLIQRLLDKWGGLTVPGEPETVTSENLYSKIFEIHTDFTPGSRQKATFIANLANATLQRLFSSDASAYSELGEVIFNGLQEKHILVFLKNSKANSYFDASGWSGRLKEEYSATPIPIEWNWGANKANLFITRNTTLDINILNEDTIQYTYNLAIQNSSESRVYPEGDYVNWFRVYLPENALITSTEGYENSQSQIVFEDGYKVIGGWFNTLFGETNRFELTYTVSRTDTEYFPILIDGNNIEMDLNIFKQPGTDSDKYSLNVIYPDTWAINQSADMNRAVNQLNSQFELRTDKEFELEWEYK